MSTFIDFARAHGLVIDPSRLYPSQRIQRCGTLDKPRSDNGAFLWDGERGWIMDWSGDARVVWFQQDRGKPWTAEEKRLWAQKRAQTASDQDRRYRQVAEQAEITLRSAKTEEHDYLKYKGFKEEKGLVLEGRLLIPMRNVVTNTLQGYQWIRWVPEERRYEKKMLTGMRAKGAVFRMGSADEVWLVEGYATALSLRAALRSVGLPAAVVVCFSAGNMVAVADRIKGRRFVFADNDESQTGQKAAEQTGLPWTMADETGWDANDLHVNRGLFALVGKIMQARSKGLTTEVAA